MLNSALPDTVMDAMSWTANTIVGSKAEYRRGDFIFARTQSPAMREAAWAERIDPLPAFPAMQGIGVAAGLALAAALYLVA